MTVEREYRKPIMPHGFVRQGPPPNFKAIANTLRARDLLMQSPQLLERKRVLSIFPVLTRQSPSLASCTLPVSALAGDTLRPWRGRHPA